MNKNTNNTQSGFTLFEIVLVAAVVVLMGAVGVLAYKRTTQSSNLSSSSSSDTNKDKPIKVESKDEAETVAIAPVPEPASPAPAPAPKPTPPPAVKTEPKKTYTYIKLTLHDVVVGDTTLAFAADLPGSYNGTCALTLKNLSTGAKTYKEAAVNGTACSFEVAKADHAAGEWKYYVNFYAKDGTVKGESTYKTFTL